MYGHLGRIGQRTEAEYRPEHYMEELGEAIVDFRVGQ